MVKGGGLRRGLELVVLADDFSVMVFGAFLAADGRGGGHKVAETS